MCIAEVHIRLHEIICVSEAEAGEVIQTLQLHTRDPRLRKRFGIRRSNWCLHRIDSRLVLKQSIQRRRELRVPVADQMRRFNAHLFEPHQQVPALL